MMGLANGLQPGSEGFYGWHERPEEVERVVATLPFPRASTSASNILGTGAGKSAFLYKAAQKVTGGHLPAQQQPRGTCVSRGFSRALDYRQCVEIVGGESGVYEFVSHAVIYGLGKEVGGEVGPQNKRESGDGLVGAWAAKAISQFGFVRNADVGDVDAGSDDLAIKYAVNGVPSEIKTLCDKHKARAVTQIDGGASQCRDMLVNGFPIACCSNQGFTMKRDSKGRCTPQGSWSHCMMWSAYDDDFKRFLVEQSWGQMCPEGPLYLDQPDNSFWIDWDVADRMAKQRDTFAIGDIDGFGLSQSWRSFV